jgi:hypothetical protein
MKYLFNWQNYNEDIYQHGVLDLFHEKPKSPVVKTPPIVAPVSKPIINAPVINEPLEEPIINEPEEEIVAKPVNVLSAIHDKGNNSKAIIFKYDGGLYKWNSSGDIYNSENKLVNDDLKMELNNRIKQMLSEINFVVI